MTTLIIHSILRWAVLILGLWAVLSSLFAVISKRKYSSSDNKVNLFFMISCDIQLLIGLILYFTGMWFEAIKTNTAEVMKNPAERFFAMEHGRTNQRSHPRAQHN